MIKKLVSVDELYVAFRRDIMGGLNYDRILREAKPLDAVQVIRCKNCEFYEEVHWERVDKFPVIVANHVCMKWGKGCQTDPDGYCFLAERKDGDHE